MAKFDCKLIILSKLILYPPKLEMARGIPDNHEIFDPGERLY